MTERANQQPNKTYCFSKSIARTWKSSCIRVQFCIT